MEAAVIPISEFRPGLAARNLRRSGLWWLLEVAVPGCQLVPFGILLVDRETDELSLRCRVAAEMDSLCELEEQESDVLRYIEEDLRQKAGEQGGAALLASLEDGLSNFFRVSDRTAITFAGSPQRAADRLFEDFVDAEVRPFETHLPLYGLQVAATKFGADMATGDVSEEEQVWVRAERAGKLNPRMFVARVTGRSMEPLIPDDSLCIFRTGVTGTRQGRYLLIEKFGESDFASRYTVKRYTSEKSQAGDAGWEHARVRLQPVNPEFEAFDLGPDEFRVLAEFVEVLGPASG